ncbi:MAG: cysteine--tRNA ligase [Desulfobacterales bacterium]|nr:MAG: cysteine--tRNA ligase [Desulfobacterales bacterium]
MTLKVFNTLGRKKEAFEPLEPGKVRMYVCGPTVYDSCHIGHARSVVVFDVIARYLRVKGYDVTYVRNFTDVDDKIIDKANQLAIEPQDVAERYIKEFYEDMDALNVERADIEPKATAHIHQIIRFIEHLMDEGFAYQTNSDVYYSVEKFNEYGKLSGRRLEEMEAGARVEVDIKKQNPFDFVLWKSSKPGEPAWKSPWGMGRPGWHIECSAMSCEYLGEMFDIHGGGKDLTFPHHENEIAQSEAIFKKPFVKYWIHNGFVNINQEKMSKSLGNFLMIKDAIKAYHPEAVRLFLLSKHYRSPIDFTEKAMDEASAGLDKIYSLFERTVEKVGLATVGDTEPGDCWEKFCEAMDDDFNSARGVGILFDTVRKVNRTLDQNNGELSSELQTVILTIQTDILRIGQTLGILLESPKTYFDKKRSKVLQQKSIDPSVIENLIQERNAARREKNWEKADEIRLRLQDLNISVEDRPEGTVWKITN